MQASKLPHVSGSVFFDKKKVIILISDVLIFEGGTKQTRISQFNHF
jgi:hypothetical protein